MFHKFVLRPKSVAESALGANFSPSGTEGERVRLSQSEGTAGRQESSPPILSRPEPLGSAISLKGGVLTMNEDETMKNNLREAMLGPSVLLLALTAISTGSSCKAASSPSAPQVAPTSTPVASSTAPPPPEEMERVVPSTMSVAPATDAVPNSDAAPTSTAAVFVVQAKEVQADPKAGETLDLVIEVKNTSDKPQFLQFTSGKRFDFQAFKVGEKETVWTWSDGRMFTQALREQLVEPNTTITLKAKWPTPPPGKYTIRAKVTANGGLAAAPFDIEIK